MSNLKENILENLSNAQALEELYRKNRGVFSKAIQEIHPENPGEPSLEFWAARLAGKSPGLSWGKRSDWNLLLWMVLGCGIFLNIPDMLGFDVSDRIPRNICFALFVPAGYFLFRQSALFNDKKWIYLGLILISIIWINVQPGHVQLSQRLLVAILHLPVMLWIGMSYIFSDGRPGKHPVMLDFLQVNASWIVLSGLIVLSGMLFGLVMLGLFSLSGYHIQEWFFENILLFVLPAIPAAAWLLVRENPDLLRFVAPIIARGFSPLAFLALLIYLPAMILGDKSPFDNREFLLILNIMLIGVLALIFFSYLEISKLQMKKAGMALLIGLAVLSLIIDAIAFSAVAYRTFIWGISENRAALLGSNFLIFIHLILVSKQLWKEYDGNKANEESGAAITGFLPVYGIWAAFVFFLFPVIFWFI